MVHVFHSFFVKSSPAIFCRIALRLLYATIPMMAAPAHTASTIYGQTNVSSPVLGPPFFPDCPRIPAHRRGFLSVQHEVAGTGVSAGTGTCVGAEYVNGRALCGAHAACNRRANRAGLG